MLEFSCAVEVRQPVDHHLRLLGGRRVVEPDQRLSVDDLFEDREIRPHRVDVEHLVVVRQYRHRLTPVAGSSSCAHHRGRRGSPPTGADGHRLGPAEVGHRWRVGRPVGRLAARRHRNSGHRLRPALRAPSARCPQWAPRTRSGRSAAGRDLRSPRSSPRLRALPSCPAHCPAGQPAPSAAVARVPATSEPEGRCRRHRATESAPGTESQSPPRSDPPMSPPWCPARCPVGQPAPTAADCRNPAGCWPHTTGWPSRRVPLR